MTTEDRPRRRESAFTLAKRLLSGGVALARLELQHGRQEIGQMLAQTRSAAVLIGIAVGLVFLALIAFVILLILGIAALTGLAAWLVALIVFFVLLVVAGLLGWGGVRRIRIGPPEETIASVKEDVEWARRLLRRE